MACYYCTQPFQDGDYVVPLPIYTAATQEHGGVLFEDQDRVEYVHQECLGSPRNA